MTPVAHAPWRLEGECVVGVVAPPRHTTRELPDGLQPLPGPSLVMALRYTHSPVGPYVELAVGQPARLGLRPGICVTTMVVTSADARLGGVSNWGFPKELGTLTWSSTAEGVRLVWEERSIVMTAQPLSAFRVPGMLWLRSLQRRADGLVVVRARVRGTARPARITLDVDRDDPLAYFGGRHLGLQVSSLGMVVGAARRPKAVAPSTRAPIKAPEPAMFHREHPCMDEIRSW